MLANWEVELGHITVLDDRLRREATALEVVLAEFGDGASPRPGQMTGLVIHDTILDPILALDDESGVPILSWADRSGEPLKVSAGRFDQAIAGDHWFPIEPAYIGDALEQLERLGLAVGGPVSIRGLLELGHMGLLTLPYDLESVRKQLTLQTGSSIEVSVAATPYPYQLAGFEFLSLIARESLGAILGDEMGLGKTLQVIMLLASEIHDEKKPNLVIAPATLIKNWELELEKFAPFLAVRVHTGGDRTGVATTLSESDVVLTTYETAVSDVGLMTRVAWNVVALDEAQNIKNSSAKRSIAVKRIPRRVGIAVTGTPVENTLADLVSITDFVLPGYLDGFDVESDKRSLQLASELSEQVAPILIRRRIGEVAQDLPERIDRQIPLVLGRELGQRYELIRQETTAGSKGASLAALTKLRQFCCYPGLVDDEFPSYVATPKLEAFADLLREISSREGKALVFTSFLGSESIVNEVARSIGVSFIDRIDGHVPIDARQSVVSAFNSHVGSACLAINPKAGGAGLNLQGANHVIHFNPEWNPATEDQASARAHRRGQEQVVTVHHLYYVGTVEEVMMERLLSKRELSNTALAVPEEQGDRPDLARALAISPLAHG
jgi:SNF2 family DNA or RNA helicase